MSTPSFGVPTLKVLAADDRFDVVGVITQPDKPAGRGLRLTPPPVKLAALDLGIPVLQAPSLRDAEFQAQVRELEPDVGAVAAYGQWIPAEIFDLPPKRSLNLHPSLLPRHRGAAPVLGTILAGDPEVGVSVLFVEDEMDVGDLLAQAAIPLTEEDTTRSMMARLAEIGAPLFVEALAGWVSGEITPVQQDHSKATWIGRLEKSEGLIDWTQPADEIARRCRAFDPWPGTFTFFNGKRLLIRRAKALPAEAADLAGKRPGTVLQDDSQVMVLTGGGLLRLDELQLENRRRMPAADLARGQRGFIGAILSDPSV
jgi:methionyl-tRNA formyltransferase